MEGGGGRNNQARGLGLYQVVQQVVVVVVVVGAPPPYQLCWLILPLPELWGEGGGGGQGADNCV